MHFGAPLLRPAPPKGPMHTDPRRPYPAPFAPSLPEDARSSNTGNDTAQRIAASRMARTVPTPVSMGQSAAGAR